MNKLYRRSIVVFILAIIVSVVSAQPENAEKDCSGVQDAGDAVSCYAGNCFTKKDPVLCLETYGLECERIDEDTARCVLPSQVEEQYALGQEPTVYSFKFFGE